MFFNNMRKVIILTVVLLSFGEGLFAQPQLVITPDKIEYKDVFYRLGVVYFKNVGNQPLMIDSLSYELDFYFVRFNKHPYTPFYIDPGDSVQMDCILSGFMWLSGIDTTDTMYVYNNGSTGAQKLEIEIDLEHGFSGEGIINGQVKDSIGVIPGATVYFFFGGNFVISTAQTDQFGFYSVILPPGNYSVAVEKDGYYTMFYDQQFDPFNATLVSLDDDSVRSLNFDMLPELSTGLSVSGKIIDSLSGTPIEKGIVIVRRGTHTPTKIPSSNYSVLSQQGIYTTFVHRGGSYDQTNILAEDYYYVQGFSDYFIPSYYQSDNIPAPFWQMADTVLIASAVIDIDISLPRDSAYGAGNVFGNVTSGGESMLSDVLIYAQSVDPLNPLFTFAFMQPEGIFNLGFLPYGTYRLVAQRIGLDDAFSETFVIDSLNPSVYNINLNFLTTSVYEEIEFPSSFYLSQNYPNPFNPGTVISWQSPVGSLQSLKVYDVLGREVAALVNEFKEAGKHSVEFDAAGLPSGVYFYRLNAGSFSETKKMILLR